MAPTDSVATRVVFTVILALSTTALQVDAREIEGVLVSQDVAQCLSQPGDVIIGYLTTIKGSGVDYATCGEDLGSMDRVQYVEAFRYIIDEINARDDILPNITLGYVVLDACERDLTALAQTMRFLPMNPDTHNNELNTEDCLTSEGLLPVRIVGLVGPRSSRMAVMVSSILGLFRIPVLGTFATSDELSDKSRFPFFMRLVPPDRFQATAIADFITNFNWTFVSLLYSTGSYGENGAKLIASELKKREVCIAFSAKVPSDASSRDFMELASDLIATPKAKVVIVFLSTYDARGFFQAMEGYKGESYIFVGGDDLQYENYGAPANGIFTFHFKTGNPSNFYNHYLTLTPENNPGNPWMPDLWRLLNGCNAMGNQSCAIDTNEEQRHQPLSQAVTIPMDGVYVYALALHELIEARCPDKFVNASNITNCIEGEELLKHLKQVEFDGRSGYFKFDDKGDMLGQYSITQYVADDKDMKTIVAVWDADSQRVIVQESLIEWGVYNLTFADTGYPRSVCSLPCPARHIQVQMELSCCWECRKCRDNEQTVNQTCRACPETLWPDEETRLTCMPIPATHIEWSDTIAIVVILLTAIGITFVIAVMAVYGKNWNVRLIKASTRELSMITLAGTLMAYATSIAFMATPSDATCAVQMYGFSLAVTTIYAPLLVKTNRIYRIFTSGKKGQTNVKLIDTRTQVVITFLLIGLQVILLVVMSLEEPVETRLRMPVETRYYVELYCDVPMTNIMTSMSYNLLLIVVTATHGFLTRKYPANFNESSHIFISVTTTTFLWAVFLPTYLTAFYAYYQATLLALCLILNAAITVLCLFLPKIYALYFVEEERQGLVQTQTMQPASPSRNQETSVKSSSGASRVGPA